MNPIEELDAETKHFEDLVIPAQKGDREAFDALFERHRPRVVAYCARLLNNPSDGEQAAQEVFVKAWTNLSAYRFTAPFVHWLLRIATNTCFNMRRTKQGQESARGLSLDDHATSEIVDSRLIQSGMEHDVVNQVYVKQILLKIRQKARIAKPPWDALDWSIFHLLYEQGVKTSREVAQRLDKPESTVKYRIYSRIDTVLKDVRNEIETELASFQLGSP